MTLHFLEWDNGLEYDDHSCELLGVYSSPEEREKARARYLQEKDRWPLSSSDRGEFREWEWPLDADILLPGPVQSGCQEKS